MRCFGGLGAKDSVFIEFGELDWCEIDGGVMLVTVAVLVSGEKEEKWIGARVTKNHFNHKYSILFL